MSGGMQAAIARWRQVAVAIVQDLNSTPSQRTVAWRFLSRWGVVPGSRA